MKTYFLPEEYLGYHILIYGYTPRYRCSMTLESLNKEKGLNARELKDLNDIDSGKAKITRYKNVHAYLKHLDVESKK